MLVLSACSAEEDEDDPAILDPSAISPDTLVTCEDNGDCGEAGSVRWSLPLEGEYVMYVLDDPLVGEVSADLFPQDHVFPGEYVYPGATVHEGVLYHHEHDRIRAIDLATAELLWTEEVDPERIKRVRALQVVGDRLIMLAQDNREWEGMIYLLDPGTDDLDWEAVDLRLGTASDHELPANDTHVLVPEHEPVPYEERDHVHHLIDVATGEVEWSTELDGRIDPSALVGDTAFIFQSAGEDDGPDHVQRVDLADGQVVDELPLPEGLYPANRRTLVAGPDADVIVAARGAMDAETGDVLWEHSDGPLAEEASVDGAGRFDEDDPGLLHVEDGGDAWVLEARTGELMEDAPDPRPEAFGARDLWHEDDFERQDSDHYRAPVKAYGPGVGAFRIEMGAGTRHLASYRAEEGEYVGVYQACAPDGMRSAGWDSPTPQRACVAPRLFAVDYGVSGSAPQ